MARRNATLQTYALVFLVLLSYNFSVANALRGAYLHEYFVTALTVLLPLLFGVRYVFHYGPRGGRYVITRNGTKRYC